MNPASAQKRIAFGYNRNYDKIVLNEGQAGCVWLIFSYYDEGKSLAEIKDILEGLNIPSPQNKKVWGKRPFPTFYPTRITWAPTSIRRLSSKTFLTECRRDKRAITPNSTVITSGFAF